MLNFLQYLKFLEMIKMQQKFETTKSKKFPKHNAIPHDEINQNETLNANFKELSKNWECKKFN